MRKQNFACENNLKMKWVISKEIACSFCQM